MPVQSVAGEKICCKCGQNLKGQKRMKDSLGQYWCLECGRSDEMSKQVSGSTATCAGCGELFPQSQLTVFGKQPYCSGCVRKTFPAPKTGLLGWLTGLVKK